ncbi:MAG: phenylalanine--tRNA ligase subunit beta, partial [Chitinophagaceae bacterium]|nr:phenylalanine--tRNA ligase subunit beta [Chitinophagaceae bacterium]
DVLRPSMLESGLEVIQYNCNRKNTNLAFFEFGKIYGTSENGYAEQHQLALYVTGKTHVGSWNQKEQDADVYYVKGVVNNLATYAGIKKIAENYTDIGLVLQWKKQTLATIEEVNSRKLHAFDIKQPVFFAAINWDVWMQAVAVSKIKYTEVPKYPAVHRDLAIVLDKNITYQQVQQATNKLNIASLQEYGLFDVFESEKLGAGKKSYALNYIFQLQDRTLTDEETDGLMQQLITTYKKELQAQIRE